MSRSVLQPSQQKLAEKLTILNDRGVGMLTRLYNIKKACGDPKAKPSYLIDKNLESAVKFIVRKFPAVETRNNNQQLAQLQKEKSEILKNLALYYFTFVDVMEFKTVNFDLTKNYLDLIITYTTLMILLSRIEERKAIIGLYNYAHEMTHGASDREYPRLGQMIVDYENPLKKMMEEFVPHSKMPCEYLSLDAMEKWIIFGFILCHGILNTDATALNLWKLALQSSSCLSLFRDEVFHIHKAAEDLFVNIRGYNKRINDIRECKEAAVSHAGSMHRERRKFLRSALKELATVLSDQPGLLGPKALFVFMALSFARDEIIWLLRHADNMPKKSADDFIDKHIAELIFYMEELRAHVRKYGPVMQRYYVQYLSGFDAVVLNELVQNLSVCPEDESIIMSSFVNTMTSLSVKQVEDGEVFDFRGMRLDWFRLQRHHIGDRSLSLCNMFLDEMAKQARNLITDICTEQCTLSDQLLPKHCAKTISQAVNKKSKKQTGKKGEPEREKPGVESMRKNRLVVTNLDKLHTALSELCFSINYVPNMVVWEHTFTPREYLTSHLEIRFTKSIVGMTMYNQATQEIAKPSELLTSVRAYMTVLQSIENYVQIDITRVFNNVLLQQTQHLDSHGEPTITSLYTNWYLETLLRQVSNGHIAYFPAMKAFVNLPTENELTFNAEEYSDISEMRSLSELLGPYGMKFLSESLMWHISSQVAELKVAMNVYELSSAAGLPCEIDPALVVALSSQKSENISPEEEYKIACLLMVFVAVSLPTLASNVMSQYSPAIEGRSCLSSVFNHTAIYVDYKVIKDLIFWRRTETTHPICTFSGHCNNIHCLAKAINQIAAALFTIHKGSIEDRLKEFLAIVQESPFLTMDLLESCFPYVLLRNAYHAVYKQSVTSSA
ncbi:hypothetical protein G4228_018530 [Cervus hanglu yarkandensis]|nr:hypothetical protein G4228_018530 [Cervus hanglu yarkandensis]